MTKHEIYEALKADGAKLPKAERFMGLDALTEIYTERFGVAPGEAVCPEPSDSTDANGEVSDRVSDSTDASAAPEIEPEEIPEPPKAEEPRLLRFDESGWCPALGRSYTRGLYRPATPAEYEALKPFAAEVL